MGRRTRSQAGNVFFTLFGAVGLVGVLGASTMTILKGPVKSMAEVTKRTVAENAMIASGKLALMAATNQADDGDCDADGRIEPVPYTSSGTGPKPSGGGYLPSGIGASLQDPWGNAYGYCVWDHGANAGVAGDNDANCGGSSNFLAGADTEDKIVLAVLSSGANRAYEVTCGANPGYLTKPAGSDDVVLAYTYAEAKSMSGGVWNIEEGDISTAEIKKNLSVKDDSDVEQLAFDTSAKTLTIGAGGSGSFPTVKTDFIQQLAGGSVEFLSNIELGSSWLSGDGGNEGIQVNATGAVTTSGALTATGALTGASLTTAGTLGVAGTSTLGAVNAGATTVTTLGTSGLFTAGGNINLGTRYLSNGGGNNGLSLSSIGEVLTTGTGASFVLGSRDGTGDAWVLYNPTGDDMRIYRPTGGDAMIIQNDGDVGIGIAPTTAKLSLGGNRPIHFITGSGDIRTRADAGGWAWSYGATGSSGTDRGGFGFFGSGDALTYYWIGPSYSSPSMVVLANGNVGVGTTGPTSKLAVSGVLDMLSNKIINLAAPTVAADATTKAYVDAAVAAGTGFIEQDPQVGTVTDSGKICQGDGTKIECNVAISSLGDNLGAGGSTTGQLLSMHGSGYGYVGGDATDFIRFDNNAGAYWQQNGAWEYSIMPTHFSPYVTNANDLGLTGARWKDGWFAGTVTAANFVGNGSGLTGITAAGDNLGAGGSTAGHITIANTAPMLTLQDTDHANSAVNMASYISFKDSASAEWGWIGDGSISSNEMRITTTNKPIRIEAGGTSGIQVETNGNVGIGNNSSGAKLLVAGNSPGGHALRVAGGASTLFIDYNSTGNNYYDGANHYFRTFAGADVMTITSTSVGIGTSSPAYKLDVNGDAGVNANNHVQARYTTNETYKSSLGWNHLQLGNNSVGNYIIGGRTTTGGGLTFVVNNTADYRYGVTTHNGTEAMSISSGGNVGIGGAPSTPKLQVSGTAAGASIYGYNSGAHYGVLAHSVGTYGGYFTTDAATYGIYGRSTAASGGGVIGYTANSSYYGILGHANAYSLYGNGAVYASGRIQSGTDLYAPLMYDANNTGYYVDPASSSSLYTAYAYYFYYQSDERLKKNIKTISPNRVADVYKLRGVEFDWKKDGKHDIGFIAQEIETEFPELVSENKNPETGETTKGVKYGNVVALLVEAAKQQKETNDAQAAEIKALKAQFAASPAALAPTGAPRADTAPAALALPPAIDASKLQSAKEAKTCAGVTVPACLGEKLDDAAKGACATEINRYIYEARIHALCVRGDKKVYGAFAKTYAGIMAAADKLGLKPFDSELGRVSERHAVALKGVLTSAITAAPAHKPGPASAPDGDKILAGRTTPPSAPALFAGPSLPAWLLALIAFNTIVALASLGCVLTRRKAA
jgi:hypothetical protein